MAGKNDSGSGKTTAARTLRKWAEETLAAGEKPLEEMSTSEMSTLIHELHIHQVELEMQNEELRKSQTETERSRRAYQDLWDQSPAGYLIVDAAGRVTAVNRAGRRLFCKPENALLNERLATLVGPEKKKVSVYLMLERAVETGIAERQEIRIKKPDGAVHICLLEVRSLGGEAGREQIQAVLTDITRQKRAENELRKTKDEIEIQKDFLQNVLDNVPAYVFVKDREHRLTLVNEALEKTTGRPKHEWIGKTVFELFSDRALAQKYYRDDEMVMSDGGQPKFDIVETLPTPEGIKWLHTQKVPLKGETGHVMGLVASSIDISKLKEHEDTLHKSEQEKTAILDSLIENVIYLDRKMNILWANKAACKSVRMKREDLLERKCHEVWANSRTPCEDCPVIKARDTGQLQMVEMMTPDGRWWHIKGQPVRDKKGRVTGMTELALDITDRKRSERELHKINKLFEGVIEQSPIPMVVASPDGELKIFNEAVIQQLGITEDSGIRKGTNLIEMKPPWKDYEADGKPIPTKELPLAQALQGKTTKNLEVRVVRSDGTERWEMVYGSPIYDDEGNLIAGMVSFPDITERKSFENELTRLNELYLDLANYRLMGIYRICVFSESNSDHGAWSDSEKPPFAFEFINEKFCEIFKLTRQDLVKRPGFMTDFVYEEDKAAWSDLNVEANIKKIPFKWEGRFFIDAEIYWLHLESLPRQLESGDTIWTGICFDITEQKNAEQELRESEEQYRKLMEESPVGIEVYSPDGTLLNVNKTWQKMWRVTAEEVVGKYNPFENELYKQLDMMTLIEQSFAGEQVRLPDMEFDPALFNLPGRKRWVQGYTYNVKNEAGEIKNVVILSEDITDRKRTEEDLLIRDAAISSSAHAIALADPEGNIFYANKAFLDMFGFEEDSEIQGMPIIKVMANPGEMQIIMNELADKGVSTGETIGLKKDGTKINVYHIANMVKDKNEESICIVGSLMDITAQKRIDRELVEANKLIEGVIEQSPIPMVVASPDGKLKVFNEAVREQLGIDEDSGIKKGSSLFEMNQPWKDYDSDGNFIPTEKLPLAMALSGKTVKNLEVRIVRSDGTERLQIASGAPIYDNEGNLIAGFVAFPDITDRRKAEIKLRDNAEYIQTLIETSQDGILVVDKDGEFEFCNPSAFNILGWPKDEVIGSFFIKVIPLDFHSFIMERWEEVQSGKGKPYEVDIVQKSGKRRSLFVSHAQMEISGERKYCVIIKDVTEKKQAEKILEEKVLRSQLMNAHETERLILSLELHDTVAQDLAVAKMTCDQIYNGLLNNRPPEIQHIQEIAGVLQKTIRGVRNMAYELRPPGLEELGLAETIYRLCEDFTQMWGVPVDFKSAGLKNLNLDYDIQINLYRLVQEGLTNIRKHASAGRVTVRLVVAFPNIILRIEDNGRGFDVQKEAAAVGQEKRMGLLNMQERVRLLNGEMKLQSKPGKGTKVSIKLPLEVKKSGTQENHLYH